MPDRKGFKLQLLVNFQKFSTVRDNIDGIVVYEEVCNVSLEAVDCGKFRK